MKIASQILWLGISLLTIQTYAQNQPSPSVHCTSAAEDAKINSFNFNLYLTGHPMGGLYSYTGMFETEGPGVQCHPTRGSLRTTSVDVHENQVGYTAESSCLNHYVFNLKVNTLYYERDQSYDAILEYQYIGQLGSVGQKTLVPMKCSINR